MFEEDIITKLFLYAHVLSENVMRGSQTVSSKTEENLQDATLACTAAEVRTEG